MKTYKPTKAEKTAHEKELDRYYNDRGIPAHAKPKPKYNHRYQSGFFESFLMLWGNNRNYNPTKVDVRGTWREDLQRYTKTSSTTGTADILMCIKGIFVGVEVKGKGDTLKPDQIAWGDRLEKAGGHYLVFDSMNCLNRLEELETEINGK